MKQLTIWTNVNRPGVLANISALLSNQGVNVEGIAAETYEHGSTIRLVTSDTTRAKEALKNTSHRLVDEEVLVIALEDKPGELAKVSKSLADKSINITGIYTLGCKGTKTRVALKVDKPSEAEKVLGTYLEKR